MISKRDGWWLVAAALLLAGGITVAVASEDDEKEKHVSRVVIFDGQARLGVRVSEVTPEKAREGQLPGEYGAVIEEVEEDSPAAKAGLEPNDVILTFAGERVRGVAHLQRLVRETPSGRTVTVEVSRKGQTRSLQVTPESRRARIRLPEIHTPDIEIPHLELPDIQIFGRGPRLGISGDQLTPQLADYFGVEQGKGVLVREVLAGSAAAKAGLKAGDVIVSVDSEPVTSVRELRRALRRQEDNQVTLTIVRDRRQQSVQVTLDEPVSRSPRYVTEIEVYSDPKTRAQWAREMRAAAREWKRALKEWEGEVRPPYCQHQREWRQEWGTVDKAWEEVRESEKIADKVKKQIQDEIRWHLQREGQFPQTL